MYCKDLKLKQDSVKSSFSQSSFNFSRSSFQGWSRAPLAPQNKHPMQHRRTWVSLDPSRFGLLFLAWNSAISTVYSMIACAMFLDSDLQWRTYHINIYIYVYQKTLANLRTLPSCHFKWFLINFDLPFRLPPEFHTIAAIAVLFLLFRTIWTLHLVPMEGVDRVWGFGILIQVVYLEIFCLNGECKCRNNFNEGKLLQIFLIFVPCSLQIHTMSPLWAYVLSTFSLFNSILYTFTPLTPSRSLAAPRGAGSSIGSGLLCNLGETRSYSNKWRSFTIFTWFLTILYTFSVFLDEILRKFFTRSLSLSILYLCSFGCRSFLLCLNIPTTLRRCFFTLRCCGLLKQWVVTHLLKPFSMLDGSWGADDRMDWVQDSTRPENAQPCRALLCFFETFMSDHAASMVFNHTHTLWTSKGFTWQHW